MTARLSGDLAAGDLVEVDGFLARNGLPDAIGLWDVTSADAEGVAALRRLRAKGVTLLGASPLLALSLETPVVGTGKLEKG